MKNRKEILQTLYTPEWEDGRLVRDRQGELEYITTMHYIHKEIKAGAKIAEIGAATGRYSVTLAKEGYDVTAVEFLDDNVEVLKKNCEGLDNIRAFQGDAVNLTMLKDDEFDATLLFGPMYHLYTEEEQKAALAEARRITKKGGVIMIAFLSIYAIMHNDYLANNFDDGFLENFTEDFQVKHFKEQIFTGFDIEDFENLVDSVGLKRERIAATDGVLELAKDRADFGILDDQFENYVKYHLHFCEKRVLLGNSSHLLLICTNDK